MKLVGLTGGIATGKSTASAHLRTAHALPIIDADLLARHVVEPSQPAFHAILAAFGPDAVLDPTTHQLDRTKLGALIFANPDARKKLNAITHPPIRIEMLRGMLRAFLAGNAICVLDTPLLFEAGLYRFMGVVIVVACSTDTQLARLMSRDSCSREAAQSRIDSQMSMDEKRKRADIVVENEGSLDDTQRQLDAAVAAVMPNRLLTRVYWVCLSPIALVLYGGLSAYVKLKQMLVRDGRSASLGASSVSSNRKEL
ncbi:hypothetical protein HDU86_005372 [Geranomyces michiganensis]|nr:hypothetical protein HDU86_005372 [Geranomyces michiganensis]